MNDQLGHTSWEFISHMSNEGFKYLWKNMYLKKNFFAAIVLWNQPNRLFGQKWILGMNYYIWGISKNDVLLEILRVRALVSTYMISAQGVANLSAVKVGSPKILFAHCVNRASELRKTQIWDFCETSNFDKFSEPWAAMIYSASL